MMIAFTGGMNVFLKTSDINDIQNPINKPGFNSTSKVSFDMFRFNSLMNDFRSDMASSKPELLSRQTNQNEKYSQRPEDINKKPAAFENNQDVYHQQYSKNAERTNNNRNDSEFSTNIDKKEVIQDRNNIEGTSGPSKNQAETATGKNDQCPDSAEKCTQHPISDPGAENGQDNGHHIGLLLSNILNGGAGGLIIDNLINEGDGSIVSEIAQSGNKSQSEIDLKTGNLLSHLIKGEIDSARTSGPGGSQSGANGDVSPDDLIPRVNTLQSSTAEAAADGKSTDTVNSKSPVSETGIQSCVLKDGFSVKPATESMAGIEENLMKGKIREQTAETGDIREGQDHDSAQHERKTEGARCSIEADRKADFKENNIRQFQETAMESGLKEMKNNDSSVIDRPLTHISENIQTGASSKSGTDTNVRTEGISSESSNNGLLNNSNTSHESIKAGDGLKTVNTARSSAFNDVVDKITYILKSNTKMDVKIHSESLGKLNINVSIEKGLVNVHINSADKAVREIVENNMQHIVDSLSKNGVSVGGFSVGLRNNKNNENMHGNGRGNYFSVDRAKEREYVSTSLRINHNNGLVNIFA